MSLGGDGVLGADLWELSGVHIIPNSNSGMVNQMDDVTLQSCVVGSGKTMSDAIDEKKCPKVKTDFLHKNTPNFQQLF
jgi:hypothetical protein